MATSGIFCIVICTIVESSTSTTDETCDDLVIGIDLGTSYSCVGLIRYGFVEIAPDEEYNRITPSWVAFTESQTLIGDSAKHRAATNILSTVYDIKRYILYDISCPFCNVIITQAKTYDHHE